MKKTLLSIAVFSTFSLHSYAMINSNTVDTANYEHNEVVRFESELYGACTGTLIAHKWILTADHCIGGARTSHELSEERWATIDKSYDKTLMDKDEYFASIQVAVRNGRPQITNGWQNFAFERAVSFRVRNGIVLAGDPRLDEIPLYDQYQNEKRNEEKSDGSGMNLETSIFSDIGLVELSEEQNIANTGYIAEVDTVNAATSVRSGYLLGADSKRQEIELLAYSPVQDGQAYDAPLEKAQGALHFLYKDGDDSFNQIQSVYHLDERAFAAGSATTIRFDNNNGMPVYAQGGNSGGGVGVKNTRTGDFDIMGVISSQNEIGFTLENLDPQSLTPEMSQLDFYYSEVDPSYIPNDRYWQRLAEYDSIINQYPNGVFPSIIGSLTYKPFADTLLNEIYALNSPKFVSVPENQVVEVRVQNLSPETLDLASILTTTGDVEVLSADYERYATTCEAVAPLDSCIITITSSGGNGEINMAFPNSKQPQQKMLINNEVKQGNWLEEYDDGSEDTDNGSNGSDAGGSDNGSSSNGSDDNDTSVESGSSGGGSMGWFSLALLGWLVRSRIKG